MTIMGKTKANELNDCKLVDVEQQESDASERDSDNSNSDDNDEGKANAGWVDSISKILKTQKPKGKKTLVLAKAKKLNDVRKEKPKDIGFQIEGEEEGEKIPGKSDLEILLDKQEPNYEPARKKKKDLPKLRVKPNVLEKDRERTLSKIATKGVVQLFNTVRNQQKDIDKRLDAAGPLERKREKVYKSIDKRAFLDVLMGEKSETVQNSSTSETPKIQDSTWNVLRDDFMMGAKLKDWDKELEVENADGELEQESDLD